MFELNCTVKSLHSFVWTFSKYITIMALVNSNDRKTKSANKLERNWQKRKTKPFYHKDHPNRSNSHTKKWFCFLHYISQLYTFSPFVYKLVIKAFMECAQFSVSFLRSISYRFNIESSYSKCCDCSMKKKIFYEWRQRTSNSLKLQL